MAMTRAKQIEYFKLLGDSSLTDEQITLYIEIATQIALATLYPFEKEFEDKNLPEKYDIWVVRAGVELQKNKDVGNVVKYSENGISVEYQQLVNGISSSLLSELKPFASVPL